MTGDQMQRIEPGEEFLRERLDAYARVRLSPSAAATGRMRARVMREARVRLVAAPADRAPIQEPGQLARPTRWGRRRVLPLLLAASFVLAVVAGAAAAGQPGGLLFDLRMWVETALLPTAPTARLDAELVALQTRLDEVVYAAGSGDLNALRDSLDAYEAIVGSTTAEVDASDDPDRLARLEEVLAKHRLVLEQVLTQVPPQAQAAIAHAIERSGHAISVIERNGKTPPAGPGVNNGQGDPRGGPGSNNGQASPTPTPKPTKTPKPSHAPPGHTSEQPNGPASSD